MPGPGQTLIGELNDPTDAGVLQGDGTVKDVVQDAADELGRSVAIYSYYQGWQDNGDTADPDPNANEWGFLDTLAQQVSNRGGILALTLALDEGIPPFTDRVNDTAIADFVSHLAAYNTLLGVPVLLRIGPEMNGDWQHSWSEVPNEYTAAFRKIAAAVHAGAPATQTVWGPAYAAGYPWSGVKQNPDLTPNPNGDKFETEAQYEADPNGYHPALTHDQAVADFAALDTNGDGILDNADDPYAPYWPGDDAVDWVGMSSYHFGIKYPWGTDTLPPVHEFDAELLGGFNGIDNDDTGYDFYNTYTGSGPGQHGKPMMISETSAWYDPDTANLPGAASELAIKQAWWNEIRAALPVMPQIKALVFFDDSQLPQDVTKPSAFNPPLTSPVWWQSFRTPELVAAFDATFPDDQGFEYGSGGPCLPPGVVAPAGATQPSATTPAAAQAVPQAVAAPVVKNVRVCTTKTQNVLVHGKKHKKTTSACELRQVRVTWSTQVRCTSSKVTSHAKGQKPVTKVVRACKQVPVQHLTTLKVLKRSSRVTLV